MTCALHGAARWLPRGRAVVGAAAGAALAGALAWAGFVPWSGYYAAESSEIAGKQVSVARAIRTLPPGAVVATMDVGAVAFIGGHPTFDVVGLTTNGISPYSILEVPGRVEALGSLPAEDRPRWAALYGSSLPQGLVGNIRAQGRGFMLYEIKWDPIDAANRPAIAAREPLAVVDRVDVADPRSEAAHGYGFRAREPWASEVRGRPVAGTPAFDSARPVEHEEFTVRARPGEPAVLVVRTEGNPQLTLTWNGAELPLTRPPADGGWTELEARVPADAVRAENRVTLSSPAQYLSFHTFLLQPAR
jgi:hypothetical protein